MDLRDLANVFNTKEDLDFQNLEVTVDILRRGELFHGTIEEFIEAIYYHDIRDDHQVLEILRRPTQVYDDTPEYKRPIRIIVF